MIARAVCPPVRARCYPSPKPPAPWAPQKPAFAALLDGLALALERVELMELGSLPRMADFARFAAAGMPALGFTEQEFITAYRQNQAEAIEAGLESSPIGSAIRAFMASRTAWIGSSADLLKHLTDLGGDTYTKSWPRSPKGLVNALRRLAPSLRHVGIHWQHVKTAERNLIELTCKPYGQAPQAPQAPQRTVSAGSGWEVF